MKYVPNKKLIHCKISNSRETSVGHAHITCFKKKKRFIWQCQDLAGTATQMVSSVSKISFTHTRTKLSFRPEEILGVEGGSYYHWLIVQFFVLLHSHQNNAFKMEPTSFGTTFCLDQFRFCPSSYKGILSPSISADRLACCMKSCPLQLNPWARVKFTNSDLKIARLPF